MTRPEAEAIIRAFKDGAKISALLLQEAVKTTRRKADSRVSHWLPELPRPVKERANAVLLWNLGLALGRTVKEAA